MKLNRRDPYSYSYKQSRPYFDAKAPGVRGFIGLSRLLLLACVEQVANYTQPLVENLRRVNPHVRAIALVSVSSLVLVVLSFSLVSRLLGGDEKETTQAQVPNFSEALTAPYDLAMRPVPADSADTPLPQTLAGYTLASDRLADAPTNGEVKIDSVNPVAFCMVNTKNACTMGYEPQRFRFGRYFDANENVVEVFVGNYWTADTSDVTMDDLLSKSRTFGYIGDFVSSGVASVDYFESSANGWYTFTWSQGAWVISISAKSREAVEEAVQALAI